MKTILLTLLGALFFTGYSSATGRFYSDFEAKSPNGLYTTTAKSPDNDPNTQKEEWQRAFQKNFTITLTKQGEEKPVWVWKQGEHGDSPVSLTLNDAGRVVMLDAFDSYTVFSPTGEPFLSVSVALAMPGFSIAVLMGSTTAGVMWRQYSKEGFFTEEGRDYFYIRAWWGRMFALSLDDGQVVKNRALVKKIEAQVVAETKARIQAFDGKLFSKCDSCDGDHLNPDLASDALIIKQYSIPEGEALARKVIEHCDDSRNSDLVHYYNAL